jgi:PAS domain S-box-containing protein
MAVRPRLIATIFAATAVVAIASALVTYLFGNSVLRFHAREELRRQSIAALDQLTSTLKDAETGQRGFIITGDEGYLDPYDDAMKRLPREMEKLNETRGIDLSAADMEAITKLVERKLAELRDTIELRRSGGFDAAVAATQSGAGKQIMDDLRSEVGRLQSKELAALRRDSALSDEVTRTRTVVFLLTAMVNILVLAWAYRRIAEAIRQRDAALTQARKRGTELEQQKDLLGVTLASIGDCVMVTDKNGRITFMNHVAEEVTGWSFEQARGRQTTEVFRILSERSRQRVENPVEKVMKQGGIVGLGNHTILVRKDGRELPIDDSGAPIREADGTISGVVLVFRDFSERRQAEQELQKAKEAAETANKAKDQFLAMLSHELRTPLTPVLATLNLWEASEGVPSSLRSDVQMLRRSIELEARIIDDLLDLTRIARGVLCFSPETTDVHALLEFLVGLSQSEFQNKQLQIALHLDAARHIVYTDAARLQQVLWNILRNAVKFTDAGGHITIATANDAHNNIDIAISDTGIGMTPETISRLFVPFEQAEPTRNRRYGGLGLGMAISNALIRLLEGKLSAKSEGLGHGSTFTVSFPTTEATAPAIQLDRLPTIARETINLLLIEDHIDTARALVRLLESHGYSITSVPTVAAGLEALERDQFDLLLCDLGLPDGTGMDFIEKVRKTHKIPAIALTGFGMEQDVERARQAGFDAHLTKPVNLQKLEATILKLLHEPQPAPSST